MDGIGTVLGLCMLSHYAAASLLFGSALGRMMLADAGPMTMALIDAGLRRILCGAALLAMITAVVMVPLQTWSMAGDWSSVTDPGLLGTVMRDTAFGRAWSVHLVLALVVCVAALIIRAAAGRWFLLASTTLLVASLGFIGHAAMEPGWVGILHSLNHAVHLLAAGAWLGGLIPLAALLTARQAGLPSGEVATALRRFSGYATVAVVIVLVSGAVNVAMIAGKAGKLVASFYGEVLTVKLVLIAVLIIQAIANRYWFLPVMAKDPAVASRRLAWGVSSELVVGFLVLAAAVVLGTSAPP